MEKFSHAAKGLHGLDVCVDLGTSFEHGPVVLALGDFICLATVHSCGGQGWQEGQPGGDGGGMLQRSSHQSRSLSCLGEIRQFHVGFAIVKP